MHESQLSNSQEKVHENQLCRDLIVVAHAASVRVAGASCRLFMEHGAKMLRESRKAGQDACAATSQAAT
jgi:hypothetical protein